MAQAQLADEAEVTLQLVLNALFADFFSIVYQAGLEQQLLFFLCGVVVGLEDCILNQ